MVGDEAINEEYYTIYTKKIERERERINEQLFIGLKTTRMGCLFMFL